MTIDTSSLTFNILYQPYSGWEEGPKKLTTSFSPVTSAKVGISSQNFLTFSFNSFATLV